MKKQFAGLRVRTAVRSGGVYSQCIQNCNDSNYAQCQASCSAQSAACEQACESQYGIGNTNSETCMGGC